jgi:hypothetical protein
MAFTFKLEAWLLQEWIPQSVTRGYLGSKGGRRTRLLAGR